MKFRKGQKSVAVPPIGELLGAYLEFPGIANHVLQIVHMTEIQKVRKRHNQQQAWPLMVAHALGSDEVHLWPTPHKAGEIKIQFYPPAQEI